MWIGGGLLYSISAIAVLAAAVSSQEQAARRREAREAVPAT
jgi:hypothetical protein